MKTHKDSNGQAAKKRPRKRAKGSGALIRKSSGIYAYQFLDFSGERKTVSLKTRDRKQAEAKAAELERTATAKDGIDAHMQIARAKALITSRKLPLSEVWTAYEATKPTAKAATVETYRLALAEFVAWMQTNRPNQTDFAAVDFSDAAAWLDHIWATGISASTFNNKRGALARITKTLAGDYSIASNVWTLTETKRGKQQKRLPLRQNHAEKLLSEFADTVTPLDKEKAVLVNLGLFAGLRMGDACTLRKDAVHLNRLHIEYTPAKTALANLNKP